MELEDINVVADYVDKTVIGFTCPYCRSRYKRNGDPYKKSKPLIHRHGSGNNFNNRIEHRVGHCIKGHRNFFIHITDDTKKV